MNPLSPLNVFLLLLNKSTSMEFFSNIQATCNVHFNNLPLPLPIPILIIEYAVWSKKNQCIGQSSTFKAPKRNEH